MKFIVILGFLIANSVIHLLQEPGKLREETEPTTSIKQSSCKAQEQQYTTSFKTENS